MKSTVMLSDKSHENFFHITEQLNISDEYFWEPSHLVPFDHDAAHIPFIFWLMKVSKPTNFIEIGTRSGSIYYAMCQAVERLSLDSVGMAVCTSLEDKSHEQGGVSLEEISGYHNHTYGNFSTILKTTPDNVRPYFGEGSIDLLSLAGAQSYESVKKEFERWQSALSDRGIVLFHNTEIRRNGYYGVWKLWEELCFQYPSFAFRHSNGLGVLAIGTSVAKELKALFKLSCDSIARAKVIKLYSSRGTALTNQAVRMHTISSFEQQLRLMRDKNKVKTGKLEEDSKSIYNLSKVNESLTASVEQQQAEIQYQKETIESMKAEAIHQAAALAKAEKAIIDISTSTSWLLTSPIRKVLDRFPNLARVLRRVVKGILRMQSDQLIERLRVKNNTDNEVLRSDEAAVLSEKIQYIPFYIDPNPHKRVQPKYKKSLKVAVHLYLDNDSDLNIALDRLRNIPVKFDLFISTTAAEHPADFRARLILSVPLISNVYVEKSSNWGFNLGSMVECVGARLSEYDIWGHFNLSNVSSIVSAIEEIDTLLGDIDDDKHTVGQIFELLHTRAKVVFTEEINHASLADDDIAEVAHFIKSCLGIQIPANKIKFSKCSGFWVKSDCILEFLNLALNQREIIHQSFSNGETIGLALHNLLHFTFEQSEGDIVCLYRTDSIKDYRFFENQEDFSSVLEDPDVKILSYYLPQFHPTPENDEWHGKDFTEWTKVRATNPLFVGHYQQHIPHPDTGYYHLDSPETLRIQAEQMKNSGVYGQVFYHYWFGGRLILEEPARMLLENKDITMRFCFCWANENWTKRWDGDESEILLKQDYSAQDAEAFIRYLIPFFKDERYIKINNRPVLFVYRPSHMDSAKDYVAIWRKVCLAEGLKEPYVIAVLTRGASNPNDFDMDAGVERVLHDWTDGAVPDVKHSLQQYVPMEGSVLSYRKVMEFYTSQSEIKEFKYIRSVVPMWDNTPRYDEAGIMLHGGTPQDFQTWLEKSIEYSRKSLPKEERFVVVNAWNEWAEGAHLEPDTRHGYAYLNAIGRALSAKSFSSMLNEEEVLAPNTIVALSFSETVINKLRNDQTLFNKFVWCLNNSTIFKQAKVSLQPSWLSTYIEHEIQGYSDSPDFVVEFQNVCVFDKNTIELMLRTANKTGSKVIPNFYGDNGKPIEITANGSVEEAALSRSPIIAKPYNVNFVSMNIRMRTDARCFLTDASFTLLENRPSVTTVIRVHDSANLSELRNAMYSLYAMIGCKIVPFIVTQNFSQEKKDALNLILEEFQINECFLPRVTHFYSADNKSDIRSKLLNEGLRAVKTRYVAFLDYDDLLLPFAYEWLIDRLKQTGKAISFGRVYTARFDSKHSLIIERIKNFEYGYTYEDFINNNHAPLHSFMIDLTDVDVFSIKYFDNHKYMEDYYLTLQLITKDNSDWDSLCLNNYIGDYIHSITRSHTLAISCDKERLKVSQDEEYLTCSQRIFDLRNEIINSQ